MLPNDSKTGLEVSLANNPTPEEISDAAAIELVKTDSQNAEAWIEAQQWNEMWRTIDILYDSPRVFGQFEGSNTQRAAVNRFILCQQVNSVHPKFVDGLFYDEEMFDARALPGTDEETVRARTTFLRSQLREMDFEYEVGEGAFQLILHGTGIWKWGLSKVEEEYSEYEQQEAPVSSRDSMGQTITVHTKSAKIYKEIRNTRTVVKSWFENREIRCVLVNPRCKVPDIRKAKWIIDKSYLTLRDCLDLAKDPNYKLPSEDEIKGWFEHPKDSPAVLGNLDPAPGAPTVAGQGSPDWMETSDDPYQDTVMCLERWDKDKVITTLNNKCCIQNRINPYGCLPYYSSVYYKRIRSFWGIGLGKIVGTDQRLQQGLENGGLALLQILLDPPFVVNQDQFVLTQNTRLRKGGAIKVKGDARTAITPLEMPKLPLGELLSFLQNSQSKSEAAGGANELFTQGAMPGPGTGGRSSATRSATGAGGVIQATDSRLENPLGRFCNQVFIPWIYQLDELNRRFIMTTPEGHDQIERTLGEELGPDYKFQPDKFLDGRIEFDVLAGTRLAAKRIVAQMLPVFTSIFTNPQIIQQLNQIGEEYIDVKALLLMWLQAIGYPSSHSIIRKMDAGMKQRQAQQQQQNSKLAQQVQLENVKHQNASELLDQKTQGGVGRDIVNSALQQGEDFLLRRAFEQAPGELGSEQ